MPNYWSIVKSDQVMPEQDMAARFPRAVSHDAVNTVFVTAPDDLTDCFVVPPDLELQELIVVVGGFLVNQTDQILVATKQQMKMLYNTKHFKLWCGNYEDSQALEDDHIEVFGVGVDRRKSLDTLKAEARADIKALVTPAP